MKWPHRSCRPNSIFLPSGPELVPRPRLIERLNAGLHRKLTLVSAPAGFGKTTLVSEWVARCRDRGQRAGSPPIAVAWLSLDESDNDPTRFLTYLIAALQTIEAGISAKGRRVERASDPLSRRRPRPS